MQKTTRTEPLSVWVRSSSDYQVTQEESNCVYLLVQRFLVPLILILAANSCLAQRGRAFFTVEAQMAVAQRVYLGRIVSLEQVDYPLPPDPLSTFWKQFRMKFEVSETIKGERVKLVTVILNLQHADQLNYFLQHKTELLLERGAKYVPGVDSTSLYYVLEEEGKPVSDASIYFRTLGPVERGPRSEQRTVGEQIDIDLDSGRMFGADLTLFKSRSSVLRRAREFVKAHPGTLQTLHMSIPNEFATLCGYPNAFALIVLPVCPETERMLIRLLKDPDQLSRRAKIRDWDRWRLAIMVNALNALKPFPSEANARVVREIGSRYPSLPLVDDRYASSDDVRRAADALLAEWQLSSGGKN